MLFSKILFSFFIFSSVSRAEPSVSCLKFVSIHVIDLATLPPRRFVPLGDMGGGVKVMMRRSRVPPFVLHLLLASEFPQAKTALDSLIRGGSEGMWFEVIERISMLQSMGIARAKQLLGPEFNPVTLARILMEYNVLSQKAAVDELSNVSQWTSGSNLSGHFTKHGRELGMIELSEYAKAAQDFVRGDSSIHVVVELASRERRTILKYSGFSQEVAIIIEGKIATYFKLSEDYRPESQFSSYLGGVILER